MEIVKLNIHFANIGLQTCTKRSNAFNSATKIKNVSSNFFWLDATEFEIFKIIYNLDSNNGYDNISFKINSSVFKVIRKLINQSYYESKYPTS